MTDSDSVRPYLPAFASPRLRSPVWSVLDIC